METTDRTMAERAEDFEDATWDAFWKLHDVLGKLCRLVDFGASIECDESFDGTMPDEPTSLTAYQDAVRNARDAVRLAYHILGDLGD